MCRKSSVYSSCSTRASSFLRLNRLWGDGHWNYLFLSFLYLFSLIETQTVREPRPYFCRHSEQKVQGWQNLQKLNNPVKTFIIQNSRSEYFWNLSIKLCLEFLDTKTCNAPVWEVKYSMRVMNRISSSGW